ncbi:MAG TPA: hypothetical protein VHT28_07045 [Silvibacterium sp.]|jgi:hypothetical protein|nr:hypothetical protein [Silvibacterium sp.]
MRALSILSGIAILFTTLASGHLLIHLSHHASNQDIHSLGFLAGMAFAIVVEIFAFIGALLLFRSAR